MKIKKKLIVLIIMFSLMCSQVLATNSSDTDDVFDEIHEFIDRPKNNHDSNVDDLFGDISSESKPKEKQPEKPTNEDDVFGDEEIFEKPKHESDSDLGDIFGDGDVTASKPKENKPSVGSGFDDDEDAFDEHKKHKEPSRSHTDESGLWDDLFGPSEGPKKDKEKEKDKKKPSEKDTEGSGSSNPSKPQLESTPSENNTNIPHSIDPRWQLENFVIEATTIYGLSEQGVENLKKDGDLVLPNVNKEGQYITHIASFAFHPKKSIEIANYVGREGDGGLKSNKDVDGFEIKNIGSDFNDTLLKSVTIPNGYTHIGQDAFADNRNLSRISFGDTITKISDYAFGHIGFNKELTLPKNLKTLGDSAFMDSSIKGTLTIPASVTDLGQRTFKSNKLTNIVFEGNNLTELKDRVFEDNNLTKINIPDSIEKIDSSAFNSNYGDAEYGFMVTLWTRAKNNPKNLVGSQFYVDPSDSLKKAKPDIDYSRWDEKDFRVEKGKLLGFSSIGEDKVRINKKLVIPDEISGHKITEIEKDAFRNINFGQESLRKYDLESVKLPAHLVKIGDFAFQSNYIEDLDVSDLESLKHLGKGAFMNNKITSINFNDGLKIIDDACFHLNELTFVFIPQSVEKIGLSAFRENKIKYFLVMNDKLTEIGEMAFRGNAISELDLTEIPNLKTIGVLAFANNLIETIKFPTKIENIKEEAFRKNNIKNIELNNSIKTIAFNAFDENPSKIEIEIKPENTNKIADGNNFIINKNVLIKDQTTLKETLTKLKSLDLNKSTIKTKEIFENLIKEGENLLKKTSLREGEVLKFIFESNFFINRYELDILIKEASETLKTHKDNTDIELLSSKLEYANNHFSNISLNTRQLERLKSELRFLIDLIKDRGLMSKSLMVQGYHKTNNDLPMPAYHVLLNVYFDQTGNIVYVLDRSYDVTKGIKTQYGTQVENIDEDNAGYHNIALDSLSDYQGLNVGDILKTKTLEELKNITLNNNVLSHQKGLYEAIKDACIDYYYNDLKTVSLVSNNDGSKLREYKLQINKVTLNNPTLSNYDTLAYEFSFNKDHVKQDVNDIEFKIRIKNESNKELLKVFNQDINNNLNELTYKIKDNLIFIKTKSLNKIILAYKKNVITSNIISNDSQINKDPGIKILNKQYTDDKYVLEVKEIKDQDIINLNNHQSIELYEIKLKDLINNQYLTNFNQELEIFIPTTKKALKAVYIKDNKIAEEYKVTKVDNGYTFKTNHLSLYGLVYENSKPKQVVTHNPNWQQDLKKHNEFINKHNQETNKTLPNTGHTNNHSILLVSSLLTLIAYKLYKKED